MLPEGQGHGSGALRRVFHQRKAVPPFGLVPQRVQHRLVAAHLQIPAEEHPAKPHGGVPPVDRQNAPRQQLPPGVPAADMVALMGQNAGALHPRKARADINAGAEETQDKGRGDLRALPHFTAGPYRLGHPAFEPHHPRRAPKEHRQGPQQPCCRGRHQSDLPGRGRVCNTRHNRTLHGGGRRQGRRCGRSRSHDRGHRRQGRHRTIHAAGGLRQIIKPRQVENAQKAPQTYRAHQPDPHRKPQHTAVLPGNPEPCHRQPDQDHHRHHRQGHKGHRQKPGKNSCQQLHIHPS